MSFLYFVFLFSASPCLSFRSLSCSVFVLLDVFFPASCSSPILVWYFLVSVRSNPRRPIVSSNGHPTERISQFVDFHIKLLVANPPSYIKDTTHFLNNLNNIGQLPDDVLLTTLDVSSLYTNIPHKDGIQSLQRIS